MKEIGRELFSSKFFSGPITAITFNDTLKRTAIGGENGVKMLSVGNWKMEDSITIDSSYGTCTSLDWTTDGLILSVGTTSGAILQFLTKLPVVTTSYRTRFVLTLGPGSQFAGSTNFTPLDQCIRCIGSVSRN